MLQYYRAEAGTLRVVPQDPEASALIQRMQVRGPKEQMPPLATEEVDSEGIAKVKEWIASLAE
jgi:mono/diheme cytochrome c family protein